MSSRVSQKYEFWVYKSIFQKIFSNWIILDHNKNINPILVGNAYAPHPPTQLLGFVH